jgi:dolichol-phosphate mannosyltransferase
MKVVVVVPTYNERANIGRLIEALQGVFRGMPHHDMHILVVDDNSPDGTGRLVEQLRNQNQDIHLLSGEKRGLGAAYTRGMSYALRELDADAVCEMDADFSHDPKDLPRLIKEVDDGCDFIIGSRYVKGGAIPDNWGWYRRYVSRVGNLVARYVAGIPHVRDCTGGFRVIRSDVLNRIDWSAVQVQGYAFQVALLHAALAVGAKAKEIPIHFADREHGESKLGFPDILEFVLNAWWIRFRSLATFVKFGIVGLSGVAVNLGVFSVLVWLGVTAFIASPIAIEASIVSNFLLNNFWTFRWRRTSARLRVKGLKFNVVSLVALVVSYSTFLLIVFLIPSWPPHVAQALAIPPAMLVNYFLNSKWTFRHEQGA